MERLTIDEIIAHCKRQVDHAEQFYGKGRFESMDMSHQISKVYWEHRQVAEYLEELKEYRKAEEQGLLLRLPCKVGDIIYEPTNRNTINEYMVTGIKEEAFALWVEWKLEKGFVYQSIYGVEVGDIGKTVFLTREAAESALAEMRSTEVTHMSR